MPLLEELLNHAEDDNTVTGKALDTILATLTLEQSEQSSQDLETWTHLKEMAIDILQVYTCRRTCKSDHILESRMLTSVLLTLLPCVPERDR